ncbi:MAG TPA: winged helix DNA-binding domain-containing protein, partial [Acidimicrobiales bacterium]|nr:winged helix DNA-binding domain-containing protein [Acidimicrobiales bacterium]
AQDARAFRLAVRSRSTGCTAASVDVALSERRTLVVSWLCRGTLHLVGAADYWWLHRLTAPRLLTANTKRLAQLGVDKNQIEAAVAVILAEVSGGPRTRAELSAAIDDAGLPTAGQVLVHLLAAASLRAHLVRGPVVAGEHCFVDAEAWLSRPPSIHDSDQTLALLARRYLAGHGPASQRDLAAFCGITLGDARRGFAHIASETRQLGNGMAYLDGQALEHRPPPPRLLGMFDPVLHGWADRSFVLGDYPGAVTSNGMFRATVLVAGRVAGTWTIPSGVVTLRPARRITPHVRDDLQSEAADVLRFLGLAPTPMRILDGT